MIFLLGNVASRMPKGRGGQVHQCERFVEWPSDETDLIVSNNTVSETDWFVGCYVGVVDELPLIGKSSPLSLSCSTSTSSSVLTLTFSTSL
jgi:hypothetical protein